MTKEAVADKVESVLRTLAQNPLGLRLQSVHEVDGRWWAFLKVDYEPTQRAQVWDALADIEERLAKEAVEVTVAAA